MPIFHDANIRLAKAKYEREAPLEVAARHNVMRKPSEESIRTEFCDGPEPEVPAWIAALEDKAAAMAGRETGARTSDRAELIERIKRGESPTWVPNPAVSLHQKAEAKTSISQRRTSSQSFIITSGSGPKPGPRGLLAAVYSTTV